MRNCESIEVPLITLYPPARGSPCLGKNADKVGQIADGSTPKAIRYFTNTRI